MNYFDSWLEYNHKNEQANKLLFEDDPGVLTVEDLVIEGVKE